MIESQDESREKYKNGYYQDKLQQGLKFQDVVTEILYRRGIIIVGYASREFQNKRGENMLGAEIKNDDKYKWTGRLFIEVAEKSHPDKPNYTPSGIMRRDNSWLFVIGDDKRFWVFTIKDIRRMLDTFIKVQTPTSIGHLMPLAEANKHAQLKFRKRGEPTLACE
jgi:hypothetical protein